MTDNHQATTRATLPIVVTRALGDADVNISFNSWPIISGVSGTVLIGTTMEGDLAVHSDGSGQPDTQDYDGGEKAHKDRC